MQFNPKFLILHIPGGLLCEYLNIEANFGIIYIAENIAIIQTSKATAIKQSGNQPLTWVNKKFSCCFCNANWTRYLLILGTNYPCTINCTVNTLYCMHFSSCINNLVQPYFWCTFIINLLYCQKLNSITNSKLILP